MHLTFFAHIDFVFFLPSWGILDRTNDDSENKRVYGLNLDAFKEFYELVGRDIQRDYDLIFTSTFLHPMKA